MLSRSLLNSILDDEALTRHLGDAEARVLIEWLVDRAEHLDRVAPADVEGRVRSLCRRGRALARVVQLWCLDDDPGAAAQLAASERLDGPLPDGPVEPWEMMQQLLRWEDRPRRTA